MLLAPLEELGLEAEPDAEPDIDPEDDGEELEPPDDEGEDGLVLLEDGLVLEGEVELEPDMLPGREAPVLLPPPVLLQPYRPPTATAMGITTKAVFLSKLIGGSSGGWDETSLSATNGPEPPGIP